MLDNQCVCPWQPCRGGGCLRSMRRRVSCTGCQKAGAGAEPESRAATRLSHSARQEWCPETPCAPSSKERAALAFLRRGVAPLRQHKEQDKWPKNPRLDPHLHMGVTQPGDKKGKDRSAALKRNPKSWLQGVPHAHNALNFVLGCFFFFVLFSLCCAKHFAFLVSFACFILYCKGIME